MSSKFIHFNCFILLLSLDAKSSNLQIKILLNSYLCVLLFSQLFVKITKNDQISLQNFDLKLE